MGAFNKNVGSHLRGNIRDTGMWQEFTLPPKEVGEIAVKATERLGLDFSGVDVIVGEKPYICEINSSPMMLTIEVAEIWRDYFESNINTLVCG